MRNKDKIKILKQNIIKLMNNSKNIDEKSIYIFAKQQAKVIDLEISRGEIKSIIYEVYYNQDEYVYKIC